MEPTRLKPEATYGLEGISSHAASCTMACWDAMDLRLRNKIAMVGGASKGLGFAVARALAAEGARVSLASRDGLPSGPRPSRSGGARVQGRSEAPRVSAPPTPLRGGLPPPSTASAAAVWFSP